MSIGNANIHQVSEIPEITKLPNGRLRVVRRFNKFTREDVDNANLGSLMGDFGDLDTSGQQVTNQGYTNLRLISVEVDTRFNSATNNSNAVLVKTYETLTSLFVQVTDEDKIEELENGTRRLTRVFRAISGTTPETQGLGFNTHISSAVASDSYEYNLAKSDLNDTGAFAELTLVYVTRDSLLSSSEDFVGSQNAIVEQWFNPTDQYIDAYVIEGSDPKSTPDGTGISGTYYLRESQLNGKAQYARSTPATYEFQIFWSGSEWRIMMFSSIIATSSVGSTHPPADPSSWTIGSGYDIKSITRKNVSPAHIKESEKSGFDGSIQFDAHIRKTKTGYTLAREEKSNVDGIPTEKYTFLKPSILSVSQDFVEDINTIQVTAFDRTEAQVKSALNELTTNHKLVSKKENNHAGIKTTTFMFEMNESDVIRYTSNNRLQVVRTIYELNSYDYNANYDIGSTSLTFTHPDSSTTNLVLSELRVNKRGDIGSLTRLEAIFTEPGESSRTESTGPNSLPGTEKISITSAGSTPVTLTETDDIKLINKQEQNNNGFSVFVRSYIKGTDATSTTNTYVSGRTYKIASNGNYSSVGGPNPGVIGDYFQATSGATLGSGVTAYLVGQITGTKITYDDIISVSVPGTVKCKIKNADTPQITAFESQTLGGASTLTEKKQAYMEVIPPSSKKIKATVTESILTSIPNITQLAFNLDDINCSVTKVKTNVNQQPGGVATATSGNTSFTDDGFSRSIGFGTNNSFFPGCYLLDSNNPASNTIEVGNLYRITSYNSGAGALDFTAFGADDNNVGTTFVATGSGTCNGFAKWFGAEAFFAYISAKSVFTRGSFVDFRKGNADQKSELLPIGTTCQNDGSAPASYITTGVIQQKARPVLTTIDGTTYYEVIKFSK
jgi:hypothetical protein